MFLETFKGTSRVFKRSSKGVSREFQGGFKDVLRKFQGRLKIVSSVFQENVTKSIQGASKKFPSSFVFAILMLHGSHRSYPSRRRACCIRKISNCAVVGRFEMVLSDFKYFLI